MKKLSTLVYCVLIVAAAVAAPTANEDFVIAEDAQTFTNAVNAAKLYTDTSTNAAVRAANAYTDNAVAAAGPGNYAAVSNAAMSALSVDDVRRGATEWEFSGLPAGAVPDMKLVPSQWGDYWWLTFTNNNTEISGVGDWFGASVAAATNIHFSCDGYDETAEEEVYFDVYASRVRILRDGDIIVPTKVSQLANDSGFLTSHQALNPIYTFTDWSVNYSGYTVEWKMGAWAICSPGNNRFPAGGENTNAVSLAWNEGGGKILVATRAITGVVGYQLGNQTSMPIQPMGAYVKTNALSALVPVTRKINGQALTDDIEIAGGVTSVNTKTGTVTLAASDVGAYSSTAGNTLAGQVATIGAHLNAEDARFVVTNYNSETHTPEAYVEIQLPDTSWSRIWSEMTRWNWLFDHYLPTNYYDKAAVNAALAEKADRAWGFYDSTTGAYAPDGYTWISSEKIAIAANLAYQRTVTTEGAIWVLESNGVVTETGGMTNGFFRISDDEGNSLFEIVKGSKRTVGADASSCQVVAGFTPTKLQIGYSIVSDVHPTLYVCQSLATQNWKADTDPDCIANVTWSGTSGAYVAQVQGKSAYSSMFVKATYEVGGETYISNAAPVSMQYIMIGGVKYAVGVGTVSGTTVLTLTVAP